MRAVGATALTISTTSGSGVNQTSVNDCLADLQVELDEFGIHLLLGNEASRVCPPLNLIEHAREVVRIKDGTGIGSASRVRRK